MASKKAVAKEKKETLEVTSPTINKSEEKSEMVMFDRLPAVVTVKLGFTHNLGDFNSARMDIGFSIPCDPDDVEATYEAVLADAKAKLAEVNAELSKKPGGPTKLTESKKKAEPQYDF